jgi:broad specificity phosphatase PhoE
MAEVYLIRHGQASFGTDNYDQLSVLGHQQATILGEYFQETEMTFDYAVRGSMERHRQTLENIESSIGTVNQNHIHAGWNEYDHEALFQAYINEYPEDPDVNSSTFSDYSDDRRKYYRILFRALHKWTEGRISNCSESWDDFKTRVNDAMSELAASQCRRVLVSASGGSLSIAVMLATKMPTYQAIDLMRQMKNTAISKLFYQEGQWYLHSFNTIPHLDNKHHKSLITYG